MMDADTKNKRTRRADTKLIHKNDCFSNNEKDHDVVSKKDKPCQFLRCVWNNRFTGSVVGIISPKTPLSSLLSSSVVDVNNTYNHSSKVTPKRKKKDKKNKTIVITCSELPPMNDPTLEYYDPFQNYNEKEDNDEQRARKNREFPCFKRLMEPVIIYVKPLLILDLNGVLCHRFRSRDMPIPLRELSSQHPLLQIQKSMYRETVGHVAGTPVIARTDLSELLPFLDQNFTLAVWTSAQRRTAIELVRMLFPYPISQRLLFLWSQNRCQALPNKTNNDEHPNQSELKEKNHADDDDDDNNNENRVDSNKSCNDSRIKTTFIDSKKRKQRNETIYNGGHNNHNHHRDTIFIKSLSKVWEMFPLWNESNTFLVDDSPEKCPQKYIANTLHPPAISGLKVKAARMLSSLEHFNDATYMNDTSARSAAEESIEKMIHNYDENEISIDDNDTDTNITNSSSARNDDTDKHEFSLDETLPYTDQYNQREQMKFFVKLANLYRENQPFHSQNEKEKYTTTYDQEIDSIQNPSILHENTIKNQLEPPTSSSINSQSNEEIYYNNVLQFLNLYARDHMGWRGVKGKKSRIENQ